MAFSPDTKSRAWFCTIQEANMKKAGLTEEEYKNPEKLADLFISLWENSGKKRSAAISVCVSSEGLYHAHMVCYGNTTTLKKVATVLFNAHVEPVVGKNQLKEYITKEGKYAEKGEQVLYTKNLELIDTNQGKRSDLDEIRSMLESGMKPHEIFAEDIRYRRFEKIIRSDFFSRRCQETPLEKEMTNYWHFGDSGTGKTHTYIDLCQKYGEDEVYVCNDYSNIGSSGGGFDNYQAEKALFMDEFKGDMRYALLLSILDHYSRAQIHCRYSNAYALWTEVHITSIFAPEQAYDLMVSETMRSDDKFVQLKRRINFVVYHYTIDCDGEKQYKTYTLPMAEYANRRYMIKQAQIIEKIEQLLPQIESETDYQEYGKKLGLLAEFMSELNDNSTNNKYKTELKARIPSFQGTIEMPQTSEQESPKDEPQTSEQESPKDEPQTSEQESPKDEPQTSEQDSQDGDKQVLELFGATEAVPLDSLEPPPEKQEFTEDDRPEVEALLNELDSQKADTVLTSTEAAPLDSLEPPPEKQEFTEDDRSEVEALLNELDSQKAETALTQSKPLGVLKSIFHRKKNKNQAKKNAELDSQKAD